MADKLAETVIRSITDPKAAARTVLGWQLGWPHIILVMLTATALILLVLALTVALFGPAPGSDELPPDATISFLSPTLVISAFLAAALQTVLIWLIGRAFGGTGNLIEVAGIVAWINLLAPALLVASLLELVLPSPISELFGIAIGLWGMWILACFVSAVHEFASPGKVMLASFGISLGLLLILSVILASLGVQAPGAT